MEMRVLFTFELARRPFSTWMNGKKGSCVSPPPLPAPPVSCSCFSKVALLFIDEINWIRLKKKRGKTVKGGRGASITRSASFPLNHVPVFIHSIGCVIVGEGRRPALYCALLCHWNVQEISLNSFKVPFFWTAMRAPSVGTFSFYGFATERLLGSNWTQKNSSRAL